MMMKREEIDREMENARASIYGFLSTLFIESLDSERLERLLSVDTVSHLKLLFPEGRLHEVMEEVVKEFSEGRLSAEDVTLDFEALMRIPGPGYIYPYESSYQGRTFNNGKLHWARRIYGPAAIAVQRCYREEELSVRNGSADFPDHIGVELEFMAHLCRKAAAAIKKDEGKAVMKVRDKQARFFREHLSKWAGDLSREMQERAETLLYRCLGQILATFLDIEKRHFLCLSAN
jgi:TorA maturation chaperone TorD